MRILITGGAGFVGSNLCNTLRAKGYRYGVYDLEIGKDIRNLHDLDKAFELSHCDTVVHLAARTGVYRGEVYPGEYLTTNIEGTYNVGKMCEKHGCRLINFSTASVYGNGRSPLHETDPIKPISLYGMTKATAEMIVDNLSVPTVTLRPFNIYGHGGRGDQVFFKWLEQLKAGQPVTVYNTPNISCRGYTYVGDIVDEICNLIDLDWSKECFPQHQTFNLGGSEIVTMDEVIEIFEENIPDFREKIEWLPMPKENILANYACSDKAREILGFAPARSFRKHLIDIIKEEMAGV